MHSKACALGRTQQAATDDTIAWPPGGDVLRLWENHRCCLVKLKFKRKIKSPLAMTLKSVMYSGALVLPSLKKL